MYWGNSECDCSACFIAENMVYNYLVLSKKLWKSTKQLLADRAEHPTFPTQLLALQYSILVNFLKSGELGDVVWYVMVEGKWASTKKEYVICASPSTNRLL